jgi:glutathione S-transferase
VVWYLNLRQIPYTQCVQPFTLPRPDLRALGVSYRRIPLLSINRDIYLDSRHILATLERLYPPSAAHPSISPSTPEAKLISKLLESWTSDGGIFMRAAALIPNDSSAMQDPGFAKDREDFSGKKWDPQAMNRGRPEGLVGIWEACVMLENTILGDGRIWIGGERTKGPGLVDIEG